MTIIYACMVSIELTLRMLLMVIVRAIRYRPARQTLATSCIWRSKFELMSMLSEKLLTSYFTGCEYHMLCITCHLEYSHLVEVDMSHLSRGIIWPEWTVHGVSLHR
jgi:hypothetical protein